MQRTPPQTHDQWVDDLKVYFRSRRSQLVGPLFVGNEAAIERAAEFVAGLIFDAATLRVSGAKPRIPDEVPAFSEPASNGQ